MNLLAPSYSFQKCLCAAHTVACPKPLECLLCYASTCVSPAFLHLPVLLQNVRPRGERILRCLHASWISPKAPHFRHRNVCSRGERTMRCWHKTKYSWASPQTDLYYTSTWLPQKCLSAWRAHNALPPTNRRRQGDQQLLSRLAAAVAGPDAAKSQVRHLACYCCRTLQLPLRGLMEQKSGCAIWSAIAFAPCSCRCMV